MNIMNDYFIENDAYIELIPVLAGIICYSKLNRLYKIFVWILFFTFCLEVFKTYYGTHIHKGYNKIWTNLYNIVYFSFLFWIFYQKSTSQIFKNIIKGIVIIYLIGIGYELAIVKVDYHTNNQVIPYIVGGLGIIFCVFNYLYSIIKSKTIINIYDDFFFWFVTAHFIYFLAFTPFRISENYFAVSLEFKVTFRIKIIATFLKLILLSIGFLWTTRNKQTSLQ